MSTVTTHREIAIATHRAHEIKRLSDMAQTFSALFSVIHVLEVDHQESALITATNFASDLARDLHSLMKGYAE